VNRLLCATLIAASTALLVTGCTIVLEGEAVTVSSDPYKVANGVPVTDEPSGLRPGAPGPTRPVLGTDGGEIDHLAAMSIADIEQFWSGAYAAPLKGKFTPVNAVMSYDSRDKQGTFCGNSLAESGSAGWCWSHTGQTTNCTSGATSSCSPADNTIGWDRGVEMPGKRTVFGDMAITLVMAHEYGHAVSMRMAKLIPEAATLVAEQQADCFAGVYMRWVHDRNSPRFTLSTGDGLNKVLATVISLRDPLVPESDPAVREGKLVHGSAFERVSAFQIGFGPNEGQQVHDGVSACAGIDEKEIAQRRADLPKELLEQGDTGELLVSQHSVTLLIELLTKLFSPASPPKLRFDQQSCPDARPSPAAAYCPSNNTITVDMDQLIVMGTSLRHGLPLASGDYTAYSVVVSRFMLAVQNQHGDLSLDNIHAGLRTACMTGVATKKLSQQNDLFQLTAGDLDEAVSDLSFNGLVAGNVNGEWAPSSFTRIDAFRTGVLGDENNCLKRWP
jgi:predicted metalloprotease